jgi:hypothetical protein
MDQKRTLMDESTVYCFRVTDSLIMRTILPLMTNLTEKVTDPQILACSEN